MQATIDGLPLQLTYTQPQLDIFINSIAKYVIGCCGRRSGKTFGAAQSLLDSLLEKQNQKVLWVDLVYSQINSYIETYFIPILKKINPKLWNWDKSHHEINFLSNKIRFRSADRPDLIVGLGYNLIICNEFGIMAYNNRDLWSQIIAPMLLDFADSRAFLIGTPRGIVDRKGKESLYYEMFKKGLEVNSQYQSFRYSSYANPQLREIDIKQLEEDTPPRLRQQELFAEFVDLSDSQIFNPDWWLIESTLPQSSNHAMTFISLDTAFSENNSSAESAATVWKKMFDGHFYCVDLWHDHVSYPQLVSEVKRLIVTHGADHCIIEDKASGQSLIQTLRHDFSDHCVISPFSPHGSKIDRATSITNYLYQGNVHLLKAPWNKDLINQCTVFPAGLLMDIVDTISQALLWARMTSVTGKTFMTSKMPLVIRSTAMNRYTERDYTNVQDFSR